MQNENYIVIQGWMINELELKTNELIIYAIIYGFCQDKEGEYNGSLTYLAECIRSTKKTVIETLKKLIDKDLITKTEVNKNGVKFCKYKTNMGGVKITPGVVKNLHQGGVKITPNNKEDNSYVNIYYVGEKSKKFIKPTIEEIKSYCKERKNNIDAETFFDFYESKGWVVGKSSMKDWKAAVRTWERSRNNVTNKPKEEPKSPYQTYEDWMAEKTNGRNAKEDVIEGLEDW